jgi:hypothetical protein
MAVRSLVACGQSEIIVNLACQSDDDIFDYS